MIIFVDATVTHRWKFRSLRVFTYQETTSNKASASGNSLQNMSEDNLKRLLFNKWQLTGIIMQGQTMPVGEDEQTEYIEITKDYMRHTGTEPIETNYYLFDFKRKTLVVPAANNNPEQRFRIVCISASELRLEYTETFEKDLPPVILILKKV